MCSKDSYLYYMDRSDILQHSDILYDDDRKLQSAIDNYNERVNEKYQVYFIQDPSICKKVSCGQLYLDLQRWAAE